ncbi:MAG: hypothetical protein ACI9ZT_002144 [Gammaproteobacteria bacterium]|jgi:hypothetical protein
MPLSLGKHAVILAKATYRTQEMSQEDMESASDTLSTGCWDTPA